MRRLVAVCIAATAALSGCGTAGTGDPLQVTDQLTAAAPADSPPPEAAPAGTVIPAPPTSHLAFTAGTLAAAHDRTVDLRPASALQAPPRSVPLPGPVASLNAGEDGRLLAAVPDADLVVRIDPATGATEPLHQPGGPVDAVSAPGGIAVALRAGNTVQLPGGARAGGFNAPAPLVTAGGRVHVLDPLATSLTPLDPATGQKEPALRAGSGATHAVADRYGRVLAIDTRGGEFLAFGTDPLIMKQRYPVPGSPYGLAYDPARDLAWTTLTATNQLVAYDVAGGEPQERLRLPTVEQPDTAAVDPTSGTVFVASADGAGIQVVTP